MTLSPRQQLTPAPYALLALQAGGILGTLPVSQLDGVLSPAQLPGNILTNNQNGVSLSGSFSGDGTAVTNVELGTIRSGGSIWWPAVFAPGYAVPTGAWPNSVVAADVNGDGKVDLINSDYEFSTVSVLTNDGSGRFAVTVTLTTGNSPASVVAADVNGDGKVDLITANIGDDTLSVFTNNGSGGFALAESLAVGPDPYSLLAADVNGDGKPDLLCTANHGNSISVLTNDGSGGFAPAPSVTSGLNPAGLVAADVNGDGRIDLVCGNLIGTSLSVLTNDGHGGFALCSSPVLSAHLAALAAADINGDGKVDLICANANIVSVLTNNGAGSFAVAFNLVVGPRPFALKAVDINRDGKTDLICLNEFTNTLSVWTNNGNGGLAFASFADAGTTNVYDVTTADVNGDGAADLITANYVGNENTLSVMLNTPAFSGSFSGNGQGLTSLSAGNISSGTLADARLSSNVALRAGGNTFTNTQIFHGQIQLNSSSGFSQSSVGDFSVDAPNNGGGRFIVQQAGNVGIGTNTPISKLHVNGSATIGGSATLSGGATLAADSTVAAPATLSFGASMRQMLNLWNTQYGIGVQSFTTYFRTDGDFSWFKGGTHNNLRNDPGPGGTELMRLETNGTLYVSGTFGGLSDRNAKERFEPVDGKEMLEKVTSLPITRWSYKTDPASRHLGPMAQDFYAAFGVGTDEKHIATVDEEGVALAAIQGLARKVESENAALRAENAELKQRLQRLEQLMVVVPEVRGRARAGL
jgi:hypothetical protein